jgi:hypothetical protein
MCKQGQGEDWAGSVAELVPVGVNEVGTKRIYSVQVQQKDYSDLNSVEKRALVVVALVPVGSPVSFAAVEFSNPSKVRLLR